MVGASLMASTVTDTVSVLLEYALVPPVAPRFSYSPLPSPAVRSQARKVSASTTSPLTFVLGCQYKRSSLSSVSALLSLTSVATADQLAPSLVEKCKVPCLLLKAVMAMPLLLFASTSLTPPVKADTSVAPALLPLLGAARSSSILLSTGDAVVSSTGASLRAFTNTVAVLVLLSALPSLTLYDRVRAEVDGACEVFW